MLIICFNINLQGVNVRIVFLHQALPPSLGHILVLILNARKLIHLHHQNHKMWYPFLNIAHYSILILWTFILCSIVLTFSYYYYATKTYCTRKQPAKS